MFYHFGIIFTGSAFNFIVKTWKRKTASLGLPRKRHNFQRFPEKTNKWNDDNTISCLKSQTIELQRSRECLYHLHNSMKYFRGLESQQFLVV